MSENTEDVEEAEEKSADNEQSKLQQSLGQAQQIHQTLSESKSWALAMASDIEADAEASRNEDELTESEYHQLMDQANYIKSVYKRIEHGDRNVAQAGGEF